MQRLLPVVLCLTAAVAQPVQAQAQSAAPALTLRDAIEGALEENPDVRRAREQLEEFRLQVRAIRADALPTLDFAGTLQRTRDPGLRNSPFFSRLAGGDEPLPPGTLDAFHFGTYFYQFELEQPIYRFGRVSHALAAARDELEGVRVDVRGVENDVALNVARVPTTTTCSRGSVAQCSKPGSWRASDSSSRCAIGSSLVRPHVST